MRISEIEIIGVDPPTRSKLTAISANSQIIGNDGANDIYKGIVPEVRDEAYYIGNPTPISYVIIRKFQNNWWAMDLWVDPANRRQGLGSKLLRYVIKNEKHKVFMAHLLTISSAKMIERMISSGSVDASVANLATGRIEEYRLDDPTDLIRPMYDRVISGINRPAITDGSKLIWILESFELANNMITESGRPLKLVQPKRGGILQKNIKFGPTESPPRS
jgi:GNAT superfamily N-acetyltransferase